MPSLVSVKRGVAAAAKKKKTTAPKKKAPSDKPKAPRKKTERLRFRNRGYKCIVLDGKSKKGLHDAIKKVVDTGNFDYDRCKADGTLVTTELPKADEFVPTQLGITKRSRLPNSKRLGIRMDSQIASVVKWHTGKFKVPLRVFFDKAERARFIKLNMRRPKQALVSSSGAQDKAIRKRSYPDKSLQNVCSQMMQETEQVVRYHHEHGLDPIQVQVPTTQGAVGTPVDLLCVDLEKSKEQGVTVYRTIELKKGCDKVYGNGHSMCSLFPSHLKYNTHNHHLLQTMFNDRFYRHTHPSHIVASPMLLVSNRTGVHMFYVPEWARRAEEPMARAMKCT